MAFFATNPFNIRRPIRLNIENVFPIITMPINAPTTATGIENMTVNGWMYDSNRLTIIMYTNRMAILSAIVMSLNMSRMFSLSPPKYTRIR